MLVQWHSKANAQEGNTDKTDVLVLPRLSPEAVSILKVRSCALGPRASRSLQGEAGEKGEDGGYFS